MDNTSNKYSDIEFKKFRNLLSEFIIDENGENCYDLGLCYGLSLMYEQILTINGKIFAKHWLEKIIDIYGDKSIIRYNLIKLIKDYD